MPGLFGYWSKGRLGLSPDKLAGMAGSMQHQPNLILEANTFPNLYAGVIHLGYYQTATQPITDTSKRYSLWMDGEFNNAAELRRVFGCDDPDADSDAALALALFLKAGSFFASKADGLFTIAIYNHARQELTLINDRYGLRPLYWLETTSGFGYGGEVKALLTLLEAQTVIDPVAVDEWFSFGYLLGNRTWIEGISLLPPATILNVSEEGGITSRKYWTWNEVESLNAQDNEDEIVEELGRLWIKAVETRVDGKRLGQFLSGGLDSRAILAALPYTTQPYQTFTFGVEGCDDVRIARQIAEIKGVPNNVIELTADNWLQPRIDAVWRTDGMGKIFDLHGAEAIARVSGMLQTSLHGSLGDGIVGGGSLFPMEKTRDYLAKYQVQPLLIPAAHHAAILESYHGLIQELGSAQAHYIEQRQRRFINNGITMTSAYWEARIPFAERNFLDFVLSLPLNLRNNSYVYSKMLLRFFPEYFAAVPRQGSGLPISAPNWLRKKKGMSLKFESGIRYLGGLVGMRMPASRRTFTDYPNWIRDEPARSFLKELLLDERALYTHYVDGEKARKITAAYLNSQVNHNLNALSLLLTFEIYLLQLFDNARLTEKRAGFTLNTRV